jgi:hypothetical protein
MPKREVIRDEIAVLHDQGVILAAAFQKKEEQRAQFQYDYQTWYSKALKVVTSLAPDRLAEFRGYYEIDPRRKVLSYGTYVIQDYFKNIAPRGHQYADFDARVEVVTCFFNQITILQAIYHRVDSVLDDIEAVLYAELQDNEVMVARGLTKVNFRAAGALVGVIIEGHLQKVASAHGVKVAKNPTIADLNDRLKSASVIDTPTWRKISFLADLRNLCSHKKDSEPTKQQVEELIQGAEWLTKNVL